MRKQKRKHIMNKTDTDNRREPPQIAVIALTALPVICLAFAYTWHETSFPQWLAHLPWRAILHLLPLFALGVACVPTIYLMRAAYLALAQWRLTLGETIRAWFVGSMGLILYGLLLFAAWSVPTVGTIVATVSLAATLVCLKAFPFDEVEWARRLLFPFHERAKERLRESVYCDKGHLREDLTNYCWADYGGLHLPVPLDAFPEWFERNRSDLETYASYHSQLLIDMKIAEKKENLS